MLLLQTDGEADSKGDYEEEEDGEGDEDAFPAPALRDLLVVPQRGELFVFAPNVVAVAA